MRNLVVGLFREAKTNYNTKMNQILCDPAIPSKKWWGIVKYMCYSAIPAICKREVFISFQKKIVNALNDFLMSQAMSVPNNDSAEIFIPHSGVIRLFVFYRSGLTVVSSLFIFF